MENLTEKQSIAVFRTGDGIEARANVLRLAPFVAGLEVFHPDIVIKSSESLADFRICLGERTAYAGRAVVQQIVHTGSSFVCEVQLDSGGYDPEFFAAIQRADQLRDRFKLFMHQWNQVSRILPQYKIVVADMQSYLGGLRQWLEQIELSVRAAPAGNRAALEREALQEIGRVVLPVIDHFFQEFERVTPQIPPDAVSVHQAYLKRHLHPFVLCSPFAYRTFAKPLGYAGDYEMVNMMARDPFEGGSVFAKVLNLWFLEQPPALAHRNRVAHLQRVLLEEAARVTSQGRTARVLNVACGPALEVQHFLAESHLSNQMHFELLDFNEETLGHVRRKLDEVKRRHERRTSLTFVNKPVHHLLKQAGKTIERPRDQQFDLVYCAGLFDYLTDPVCQRLMTLLYSWLAPQGLLLATNVDPSNPLRFGMEHLLDWHLVYRNGAQFRTLKPDQVAPDEVTITSEFTGVNLFLEVRRNGNA